MKTKVTDFLKPNILIIFGALLFLFYMDWLSFGGAMLAIGIIAVICAVYFLAIGIVGVVMGDKFSPYLKNTLEVVSICLFSVLMFVIFLITTINNANVMGPTEWIVNIIGMIASSALAIIYSIYRFTGSATLSRFAYLFSAIFALALLLNVLTTAGGTLGGINIFQAAIYTCFIFYLFNSFGKNEVATSATEGKAE